MIALCIKFEKYKTMERNGFPFFLDKKKDFSLKLSLNYIYKFLIMGIRKIVLCKLSADTFGPYVKLY